MCIRDSFNELLHCPDSTLGPLLQLVSLVLELDTGHHTAAHVPAALYVTRLAVRVEAFATVRRAAGGGPGRTAGQRGSVGRRGRVRRASR